MRSTLAGQSSGQAQAPNPAFSTRIAATASDLRAAQALRYDVFVRELGGDGAGVDHEAGLEKDQYDDHADHLLLCDETRPGAPVVGVYRLMTQAHARAAGQFYTADEYDLGPLLRSGRNLLELGRSCIAQPYRGGAGMFHLWQALAGYVATHQIQVLFGVASFHGTDVSALAHPLSQLNHRHLVPAALRARSRRYQPMDVLPPDQIDRRRAALEMPALIKAYLRLGGTVGDGAYVDHAFNTTDVCLILDTARLNARQRAIYTGNRA